MIDRSDGPAGLSHHGLKITILVRPNAFGPTCVRNFVLGRRILGDRTPDQWQQDAFGQVGAWQRALALRA